MKKLIKFEIKKLYNISFLKLFIVTLFFVNIFNIYSNYDLLISPEEYIINGEVCEIDVVRYEMDKDFTGAITGEKVSALKKHKSDCQKIIDGEPGINIDLYFPLAYTDMVQTGMLLDEMERLYTYSTETVPSLMEKNDEIKNQALDTNDRYAYRCAELIEKTYSNRDVSSFHRVNEFAELFGYKLSSLCVLLIICFASSYMFSGEKEKSMNAMIRCTDGGKAKIFFSKLIVLFLFCVLISTVFFISDLGMFYFCRRPSGFFQPLYAIKDFLYSPFNGSILGGYILVCIFKTIGAFAVSSYAFMFSSLFRKSYISLLFSLLTVAAFMYGGLYTAGIAGSLKYINPISLMTSINLFGNLLIENIFGFPVYAYLIAFIGVSFVCLAVIYLSYRFSVRRTPSNA